MSIENKGISDSLAEIRKQIGADKPDRFESKCGMFHLTVRTSPTVLDPVAKALSELYPEASAEELNPAEDLGTTYGLLGDSR